MAHGKRAAAEITLAAAKLAAVIARRGGGWSSGDARSESRGSGGAWRDQRGRERRRGKLQGVTAAVREDAQGTAAREEDATAAGGALSSSASMATRQRVLCRGWQQSAGWTRQRRRAAPRRGLEDEGGGGGRRRAVAKGCRSRSRKRRQRDVAAGPDTTICFELLPRGAVTARSEGPVPPHAEAIASSSSSLSHWSSIVFDPHYSSAIRLKNHPSVLTNLKNNTKVRDVEWTYSYYIQKLNKGCWGHFLHIRFARVEHFAATTGAGCSSNAHRCQ
uniref:Uncharacterized protein n=3 Tax=Oryza TaxID=4527 RepID=Q2R714_ORYSJ|nr:hypothetical protein [Oryza sativa Japonica Group]AAX96833.1 hypothetical protein LOC_Os11g18160 [Oryza sativa Japonica Group]ABA92747.1 hypothetical protein LOC_Os11g18160 [Oryza sativa Japonica Group]